MRAHHTSFAGRSTERSTLLCTSCVRNVRRAFEKGIANPLDAHCQDRYAKVKTLGNSPENVLRRLVNKKNIMGQTPLMLACRFADEAVISLLVELGTKPD